MKKNVAGQFIGVQMISATDGSDFTGTVSVYVTIDGGTQAAGGGTVTHKGNGYHSYAATQAETNGDHIAFTFKGTGALTTTLQDEPKTDDPTAAQIADAVWDEALAGHAASGSAGAALTGAGSAGDPWTALLPGGYGAGTAGYIVGTNIDALISSRLPTASYTAPPSLATLEGRLTAARAGYLDNLNGHTPQTGDAYVVVSSGVHGNAALKALIDAVDNFVDTEVAAILAAVDTEVAAIKAKTDQLTFTDAGKVDATVQAAADLKTAVANRIADHVLRRSLATALASADGDAKAFRSLAGAVAKLVNKVTVSGANLITYEPDDVTALGTQTVTTDAAAEPIIGVDTV